MMTKDEIKYRVFGDVHLGHRRVPITKILESLSILFNGYSKSDYDIIFIQGDVFDRLLDANSSELIEATAWMGRFCAFCARNKIKLRVLEGTPSHDWHMSEHFKNQAIHYPDLDFLYIKTVHIEYMSDLGIHILYIPDEAPPHPEGVFDQIQIMLKEKAIKQVDIAIMHGCFEFQLPPQVKSPKHNQDDYLKIVKGFITINHHHTFNTYQRIIAPGSVERLAHGEEDPKGVVDIHYRKDGDHRFYFIENKDATIFKTLDVRLKDIDAVIKNLEKKIHALPIGSHVRLRAKRGHPILVAFDEVKKRFPFVTLSKISDEEEAENKSSELLLQDVVIENNISPVTITKDNITDLLVNEIIGTYPSDLINESNIRSIMEEFTK